MYMKGKTFFNGRWKVVEEIGKGTTGTVYKAVNNRGGVESYSAIKEILLPKDKKEILNMYSQGATDSDITECAFMFSIECTSDKVLIVHENVNPDRSTLIFLVKKETYDKNIREIYDFLQSPEINKRSSLREKIVDIRKAGILRYRSINHDEMYSILILSYLL